MRKSLVLRSRRVGHIPIIASTLLALRLLLRLAYLSSKWKGAVGWTKEKRKLSTTIFSLLKSCFCCCATLRGFLSQLFDSVANRTAADGVDLCDARENRIESPEVHAAREDEMNKTAISYYIVDRPNSFDSYRLSHSIAIEKENIRRPYNTI